MKMERLVASQRGVLDLEEFQFGPEGRKVPLFHSWTTKQFEDLSCVLLDVFRQELQLKQTILQELAHTVSSDLCMVYLSCWLHQPFIPPKTRMMLEALLLETGHRPLWCQPLVMWSVPGSSLSPVQRSGMCYSSLAQRLEADWNVVNWTGVETEMWAAVRFRSLGSRWTDQLMYFGPLKRCSFLSWHFKVNFVRADSVKRIRNNRTLKCHNGIFNKLLWCFLATSIESIRSNAKVVQKKFPLTFWSLRAERLF